MSQWANERSQNHNKSAIGFNGELIGQYPEPEFELFFNATRGENYSQYEKQRQRNGRTH